ncbi:Beta-ketoacyl-acyl-carrier-protein synthase I [Alloiococcus otitis]|uniref:Enoyl reductase (ER) domain-containing protein n=1 Tax=Alloiococcus otitis ATCC 51267 TaxID=883081 RepID=K9EEE8_9LACT|nr:NAD(P)H-quinone oxidoreductase [Alloiococcus otitis]EKU94246.1 hypothetical protein HMPREF9698_00278 [Alloiococcus otitis ATCC 51267]SUU81120.1 Beta-ketoacyl-acyl-carrier-protein synthase I [Alloiococcus otitis]
MRAVKMAKDTDDINLVDIDQPAIQADQILVEVQACGVNRLDLIHRKSKADQVLGVEVAGRAVEVGDQAQTKVGSRVMGLGQTGGYADYAVLDDQLAMPVPEHLSFVQAAAIPEVFLTAYQCLFTIGQLKADQKVLIHAGASGVGTAAIQLARQVSPSRIYATAGSSNKIQFCQDLGADLAINYKEEDFAKLVSADSQDQGVDLILDFVGANYWHQNIATLATDGKLVLIGLLSGSQVKDLDLAEIQSKRLQIEGTLLSSRSLAYKRDLVASFTSHALDRFQSGRLEPIIDQVFPFENVEVAHQYMTDNKNIGKIILDLSQ